MAAVQIYSASAGSGKTFTLVKEYLKVLFRQGHKGNFRAYTRIMAITFTNKATDEMKRRVIETLKDIASGEEPEMLRAIRSELDLPDRPQLYRELADGILVRLLRDFSNFNIQTIDSFFQDIIRSFARELKLPLNFEVELDSGKALEIAVEELIGQIGFDDRITTWLKEYAYSRLDEDKGWNFRSQIMDLSAELFDEQLDLEALEPTAENIVQIKKELRSVVSAFETSIASAGREILEDIERRGIPLEAYNANWLGNIRKAAASYRGVAINISDTYLRELSHEKSPLKKDSPKKFAIDEKAYESDVYLRQTTALLHLLTEEVQIYYAAKEALNHIYALGVIHQLNHYLKKYRRENNILFIIDAARLLAGFISLEDMPFLFEKIGSRIEYLFIDEFQDTSTVQWSNMLPLIRNILASSGKETRVMLVGDAKQSIYRWRGGDYRLITGKAAESIEPFESQTIHLEVNYRSHPEIVDFNNRFFETVRRLVPQSGNPALTRELTEAYAHVRQEGHQQADDLGHPGKVAVHLIEKNEDGWKQGALLQMDEQIAELRSAGYAYHDLAILVKTRQEGIDISRHLQRAGIEVVSMETLLLKFDPDVKLATAALYFISEPDIALHYVNLLWQYALKKGITNVEESAVLSDFRERRYLAGWIPGLAEEAGLLAHQPSYRVFERIVALLGLDETENLFLGHLRQVLFDFFRRESSGLREFLEWWEENKDRISIALENGANKINILTIHKAKGLEFRAVIIPFCDWDFYLNMHKDILWLSDERLAEGVQLPYRAVSNLSDSIFSEYYAEERKWRWIDSLNVLYVALTRAQEALFIYMPLVPKDKDFPKGAAKLLLEVFSDWGLPVDQPGLIYETGVLKPPVGTGEAESVPDADWRLTDRAESSSDLVLRAAFENRQTRIGNLVHDTLYYYSGPKSDLAHAFTRAEQSGNYHTEEVEIAQKHLERIVAIPLFRKWMAEAQQSWNEQDLWFKGKLYRPDKILRLPDRFIIVDYKTGEQQPEYHKQVSQYKEAVEAIFPGTAVEGYVLYTEDGTLEAVPA